MMIARISERGQISIPAAARRRLGIKPNSNVTIEIRDNEIAIRPARSISDVAGIFHQHAKGKSRNWERIRTETEAAIAREVENEIQ